MNDIDLKRAFGRTPKSVEACVRRSLDEGFRRETEGKVMKRKITTVALAAALLIVLAAGTALAMSSLGLIGFFSTKDSEGNQLINEAAAGMLQQVDASYTGQAIDFKMLEAIYDEQGKSYALSYEFVNKAPDDKLYVLCEALTCDGERAHTRTLSLLDEFIMPSGATQGGVVGELPDNVTEGNFSISFAILRVKAEIVDVPDYDLFSEDELKAWEANGGFTAWVETALANGQLPRESDGVIVVPGHTRGANIADTFVESGMCEMADRFTLNFKLDRIDSHTYKYAGDEVVSIGDYELRITKGVISPTSAQINVQLITETPVGDGGKGFGPMWGVKFTCPGYDHWTPNSGGSLEDPVQLEDGRWMYEYNFSATSLRVQPSELIMTLSIYDEEFTPTEQGAVTLKFE